MSRKLPQGDYPNKDFCEFLLELAEYEKNVSRNIYKYRAYRKAAETLAHHPTRIKNGEEAKKLDGIGSKIAKKIDEFLETGKLRKLEKIRANDDNKAIAELTKVSGIGPAAAKKFVDEGIRNIEDLRENEHKLNKHQKIGLKYLEEFQQSIPRAEMEKMEKKVKKEIMRLDDKYVVTVCGSYRRGAPKSGDVDVLLTHTDFTSKSKQENNYLKAVTDRLEECKFITDIIHQGKTKSTAVCQLKSKDEDQLHRRIDIRFIPHDQYYCGVLYFTGSDLFNQDMRAKALAEGFTLNEYTIRPVGSTGVPGEPLPVTCERDIFEYINYPYKKPEERNS
ncbi:DNA polymerase beta-like [Centruroides vittatus]|uniref:DNA polymerase beta-like n=1 Tax=Centruroides vittatus TaxID=120091 RepID=UPI003510B199